MNLLRIATIATVALLSPFAAYAQDSASYDLNTLLRDASYVFNRFEEMSGGVAVQIDHYPVEVRKGSKAALSVILKNVDTEKPALNALISRSKASSVELLDVYTEVVEVVSELDNESTNSLNWGDPKLGTDLEELSSKASVLGAKLGATLRSQIAAQELQLSLCARSK